MKKYSSFDFSNAYATATADPASVPQVPFEVWAGQLTHDLKTPLATIKAFAELAHMQLKQKGETGELYFLEQISTQVDVLTAKLNGLLKEVPRSTENQSAASS